ncbi:MAG: host attachment protein [Planctomycetaceae bacterium]
MTTWTLVANETRARLFASDLSPDDLTPVRDFSANGAGPEGRFADELLEYLTLAQKEGRFRQLALAAPSGFLDLLRSNAGDDLSNTIFRAVAEDLTNNSPQEVARQIHAPLWIVVADRARARVLKQEACGGDQLVEVCDLVSPKSQMKPSEAQSDRPGRFSSGGGQREVLEPRTDFRHKTAEDFAVHVVDYLDHLRTTSSVRRLMIAAPPLFLGELRKKLTPPISKLIEREVDKEWTSLSLPEIARRVFESGE